MTGERAAAAARVPKQTKQCSYCGDTFVAAQRNHTYCSPECRQAAAAAVVYDWQQRHQYYRLRQNRRNRERRALLVPSPRSGGWTKAEDAIALREDITTAEKAVMLHRSYNDVGMRRHYIRESRLAACDHCGEQFQSYRGRRFCSHECFVAQLKAQAAARKVTKLKPCAHCGDEFTPRLSGVTTGYRTRYCSSKCAGAAWSDRARERNARPCAHCGRTFYNGRDRGGPREQRYCSNDCRNLARRKYRDRPCKHCGKVFRPKPTKDRRGTLHCSTACRFAAAKVQSIT